MPELGVALLCLGFILITVVWLAIDQQPPDGDASRHLNDAFTIADQLNAGHKLYWFRLEPSAGAVYPPLTFLVGGLTTFVTGLDPDAAVLGLNLLFVPLLALGCYLAGRVSYGRWAGLLAVAFAFATPVVIGQFHLFMIDLPLAAMVALTAGLLLASQRFADRKLSLAAGVAAGFGLLTKQSVVIFIAPLVLVVLARGGLRNWRNLALFAAPAALIAAPWYVYHLEGLTRVAREATYQATAGVDTNPYGPQHSRWSLGNFAWYAWTAVNVHYFLPLVLMYLVGLVTAVVSWVRTRSAGLAPELIAGSLGGYLGTALVFGFQDARYAIPALVFVAVLGAGWIVRAPRGVGLVAVGVLTAVLVLNTVDVNTGALGWTEIRLPGVDQNRDWVERRLVVLGDQGYSANKPKRTARIQDVMEAARQHGIRFASFDSSPTTIDKLGPPGLLVFARAAGIVLLPGDHPAMRSPQSIFLVRRPIPRGGPRPCTRFEDGSGLYVYRRSPARLDPLPRDGLYCPL